MLLYFLSYLLKNEEHERAAGVGGVVLVRGKRRVKRAKRMSAKRKRNVEIKMKIN